MVKIQPTKKELNDLAIDAAILLEGWLTYFPAPECREQETVVQATVAWMQKAKETVDPESNDHV